MLQSLLNTIETSWPPPNYADPVTRNWGYVVANLMLLGLVILTISLRISNYFGLDDVLMVAALVR
jgi:hypothetical protein